jgi:hypothetical protein
MNLDPSPTEPPVIFSPGVVNAEHISPVAANQSGTPVSIEVQ